MRPHRSAAILFTLGLVLSGANGCTTCARTEAAPNETMDQGDATETEMMEDVIRDSDR